MHKNSHYPADWREIAAEIKALSGYSCQSCGKQCRRPGEYYLGWEYELTVAHLDNGYEAEVTTVAALCIKCHFVYDAPFVWHARRRALMRRLRHGGQLTLLPT